VKNERKQFVPFHIVTEDGWKNIAGLSSLSVGMARFSGGEGMSHVGLEDIEDEYGTIEAQYYKLVKSRWNGGEWDEFVIAMVIWTETSIVIIGSNERFEWLQNFPRHPSQYDVW
jgi:hypothetical protein